MSEQAPPAPPATPPAPAPAAAPPAAPAPDLGALQAEIDRAKNTGGTEATSSLLKALGFDKLEDAQTFVRNARDAETAALSEVDKRERAAADREKAAGEREAAAAALINRGVIREALRDAGVSAVVPQGSTSSPLDDAEGLVRIDGDVTAETAKAAVDALKAKPAFASLFTATTTTTTPPPSGFTPAVPPPSGQPSTSLLDKGAELARQRHPQPASNGTAA